MREERQVFEILHKDAMGRIGKLETPHGRVETPALMPVINPNIDFIPPSEMKKFGAEILITNSYIIYRTANLRDEALNKGLHSLLGVDLPVMTDSGSYQLMVYGDVEIDNRTIVEFQNRIGSDIVVPLDIPTPPDADFDTARNDLNITLEREREAYQIHFQNENPLLLAIPVQGSTHPELRRESAEEAQKLGDVIPVGGVVPLLDTYRFGEVARIILEVKSVISPIKPIHLFGAGHPMVFALFAALGCDLFDSAAYALYAKDDRYLTPYGTKKLAELQYFPCSCPVCLSYTPEELRRMEKKERQMLIAEHNLYASFEELRRVKQAIRENTLFELVESRIRSHPSLVAAWRTVRRYIPLMEKYDPTMKRVFFYTSTDSCFRPAIIRHHERVLRIEVNKEDVTISTDQGILADFYLKPVFGVVPAEMLEVYPAGHAEMPEGDVEAEAFQIAVEALKKFLSYHRDKKFRIFASEVWRSYLVDLPENAVVVWR